MLDSSVLEFVYPTAEKYELGRHWGSKHFLLQRLVILDFKKIAYICMPQPLCCCSALPL